MGSPTLGEPCNSSQSTASSDIDTNAATPSPNTRETTPLQSTTDDDSILSTPKFSPNMRILLESCRTDRGKFLREIGEARAVLPTGQGWEAAIATKVDNANLRDRMKIYHRFECYNIYKHVVEAGYHTGTHWIRDMRTTLANKLCREFPQRFRDQKAANRSLNWVDQGCKYHEWAGHFKRNITDLGYLIALPLDVPHSAYTSRCTKERMHAIANELKGLGIEDLVIEFELTALGNHIAVTLRDLTGRKPRGALGKLFNPGRIYYDAYMSDSGDTPQDSCNSPRPMPGFSGLSSHILTIQPGQNPTPPESLIASLDTRIFPSLEMEMELEYPVNRRSLDHHASVDVCRSIAEDWAVPLNDPFENSTTDIPGSPILNTPLQTMDMNQSAYLRPGSSPGYNDALGPLNEWDWNTNYTESLMQY
ncbi:uncharacterized protein N7482_000013 [Penicillium canariense]|uniref:Uncharacterized protein n=1 Tax=Penicillium canariense TaxID=189055 RepID=A0A9W9IEI4_9EURO|nr:uncharacterized protein N7482_000013 [Penicillium canariense]KAJ5174136.1 hypothetical protein N7482_000013 [Penicillium canariense]